MTNYYPLALNNEWHYRLKDRTTYLNKISTQEGHTYVLQNGNSNQNYRIKATNNIVLADFSEPRNMQQILLENPQKGDQWLIPYQINGLNCAHEMTVIEIGKKIIVEGHTYDQVIIIESEDKILINNNMMPLKFFTQYYYANNIGPILTTSSAGEKHSLIKYNVNNFTMKG